MAKIKSRRQVAFLLSKGSPLTGAQKSKLKSELHSGAVQVRGGDPPQMGHGAQCGADMTAAGRHMMGPAGMSEDGGGSC